MIKKLLLSLALVGSIVGTTTNVLAQEELKEEPKWSTHVEMSYVSTNGNTDTQTFSVKLESKLEKDINRYFVKFSGLYAKSNDQETASQWLLNGRWEKILTKKMFAFVDATYLADKFSGYDYRLSIGPGIGYDFVKSAKHDLKGLFSVLYYYDNYIEGSPDSSDSYVAGKGEINYRWLIRENLKFKEDANFIISFNDTDKYFLNSETGIETKINSNISLGVSYRIAYQNQLPSPDVKHTDTTFLTSLIIDF
jgi:putative salt-induced outer membrane protein